MKHLVICCDGTWKRADEQNVSNIEKIARAIDPVPPGGPPQVVYYTSGVGTGATRAERMFGGAFGLGLDAAIIGAYRFLALNYEPGDEVYVFGFSRGAYTARSLVGMIAAIGLLTPDGVVRNRLGSAITVYRNRPRPGANPHPEAVKAVDDFREFCYSDTDVKIRFLGVFDTVGSLGVPGVSGRKYRFHNVELTAQVAYARQALALDERRRPFAPSVWRQGDNTRTDVKQVWFEGVHTDIGGGYPDSALSDLTLTWMIDEARNCRLAFHQERVDVNLQAKRAVEPHDSMTAGYRMVGLVGAARHRLRLDDGSGSRFRGGWRLLEACGTDDRNDAPGDWAVRIAAPAYEHWKAAPEKGVRAAPNVGWWIDELRRRKIDPESRVERLPWPVPVAST
ncbi:DUF2235 domain-containing protein [Rhodococcus sp. T2V]|uniref:DUF2235 domain-containing protein n=1 Tax=Rhodococcus sp. T2V TaxID=3034164 RepID=UPI0023E2C477|nr:DUF2235 domain-containing protein [Rhodococcus sp. T2V]MDF3311610.1 DUF2235 domain-containing protein [Rhodococcus sp. T2V]